jgi:hypothetical protein
MVSCPDALSRIATCLGNSRQLASARFATAELRQSHIIPEHVYQHVYDDLSRFSVLPFSTGGRPQIKQHGLKERLLCHDCEQLTGLYDSYAKTFLQWRGISSERVTSELLRLRGIDYAKLKLFILATLFRSHASKQPFFSTVNLGPHAEPIRQTVLSGDPGPSDRYPLTLIAVVKGDYSGLEVGMISQPERMRADGNVIYRFFFGGLMWIVSVSSHRHPSYVYEGALQEDGSIMIIARPAAGAGPIANSFRHLHKKPDLRTIFDAHMRRFHTRDD